MSDIIQSQEIAADNLYDDSNDGIDSIQQDNLKILEQDEHEPTKKEDSPSPATKKTRKSTNAKGKQPAKKQNISQQNEEDLEDSCEQPEGTGTSLGK